MTRNEFIESVFIRNHDLLSREEFTLLMLYEVNNSDDKRIFSFTKVEESEILLNVKMVHLSTNRQREFRIIKNYDVYSKTQILKNLNMFTKKISTEITKSFIANSVKTSKNFTELIEKLENIIIELETNSINDEPYELIKSALKLIMDKQVEFLSLVGKTQVEYYDIDVIDKYDYSVLVINNDNFKSDFDLKIYIDNKSIINFELNNINFANYDLVIINENEKDNYFIPNLVLFCSNNFDKKNYKITNQTELLDIINFINNNDNKRVKIVQSEIDEESWYHDKIGGEFIVNFDELSNTINELSTEDLIWFTDCNFIKNKFNGISITRKVTKTRDVKVLKDSESQYIKKLDFEEGDFTNSNHEDVIIEKSVTSEEREEMMNYFNTYLKSLEK